MKNSYRIIYNLLQGPECVIYIFDNGLRFLAF